MMWIHAGKEQRCDNCGTEVPGQRMCFAGDECYGHAVRICAHCIRIAGIILARAEKDAAKDDVPAPEGERK